MIDVPVEVKDTLREGTYKKNYRFVVLNEDGTESEIGTIDNDNLVSESVSIDERMCSGDTLKFGLCEGSSLEFQYFGKPNITGKRVQAFVDVIYGYVETYVSKGAVPRYSQYTTLTESGTCYLRASGAHAWQRTIVMSPPEYEPVDYVPTSGNNRTEQYLEGLKAGDRISVYNPTATVYLQQEVKRAQTYTIPMGFFDIKKCSRQASTGIIKATCYNKLQSDYLDAKANENIVELVDEGELGLSGSLSYYRLLEELLDGYKIEVQNKATAAASSSSSVTSYNTFTVDNFSLYVKSMRVHYDGTQLYEGEYYNFRINVKAIFDAISEYYGYTTRYVTVNGIRMSMYDYCLSNYGGSEYFGGVIEIRVNQSLVLHKGGAHYWRDTGESVFETGFITSVSFPLDISVFLPNYNYDDYFNAGSPELDHLIASAIEKKRVDLVTAETFADVTIRDLQSAVYETQCQFGQLSRVTDLFSGVELNHSRLYPADSLYPATDLYPSGAAASGFRSMYSKLWADEGNVHKWRYLIITYKGLDGEGNEQDYTLQRTINNDGTDNYNCSDNWLFRNLVWTAEQIGEYADAMVAKMQDVTWFPFEMWCAGLPYIETGDEIEIPLGEHSYTSYVLQRQLKGIQNLQDTYINGTLDIF